MKRALVHLFLFCLLVWPVTGTASAQQNWNSEAWHTVQYGTSQQWLDLLSEQSVESLYAVRFQGRGLLHEAIERGPEFWRPLLDKGWPVAREESWTPQHEAALKGDSEALVALVRAGAPVNVRESVNQGTPLHVAAFHGHFEVVRSLVGAGANINARDGDRWTALSHARDQGFPNVVDWLRRYGATR